MSELKCVLSDWDDTLVETFAGKAAQWQEVRRRLDGQDVPLELIRKHWSLGFTKLRDVVCDISPGDEERIKQAEALIAETYVDFPKKAFEETEEFLRWVRRSKIQLGLVTSLRRNELYKDFAVTGIPASTFDAPGGQNLVYTEGDSVELKPSPTVFDKPLVHLRRHGVAPDQLAYVGDALTDYYATKDADLPFVAVTTGPTGYEAFLDAGLDSARIVRSIGAVPRALERLGTN